ncbi:hypothetical protein [Streptomyces sp. NRRL F-525]|uniref:hypothetical protein n=1 Tax=Streptomyces sp. NRRL F-525 TaxID=1463861 RepID=UPI0005247345|nr:hypothetical protein [Streptomyces sp. NRRL F-525]
MPSTARCPRCTASYDPATAATSRVTLARTIPICSPCGSAEALRDEQGNAPIPHGEWPVTQV